MTVAYRHMRQSKIITHFNRAKANLETTCSLLEKIGRTWWTARGFARLGKRALRNVDEMQDKNANERADSSRKKSKKRGLDIMSQPFGVTNLSPSSGDGQSTQQGNNLTANPGPSPSFATDIQPQNNFLSPMSGTSISQDSTSTNMNDPWYGQAMIPGVFDDFDNLLGGYVDLAFPTNLWSSSLFEDGSSMDLSASGGHVT